MSNAVQQFIGWVFQTRNLRLQRGHLVRTRQRQVIDLALEFSHALWRRVGWGRRPRRPFHWDTDPGRGKLTRTELDFHTIYSVALGVLFALFPKTSLNFYIGGWPENFSRIYRVYRMGRVAKSWAAAYRPNWRGEFWITHGSGQRRPSRSSAN